MKILWVCNAMLAQVANDLAVAPPLGGGWMTALAKDIVSGGNIDITVCFPYGSFVQGETEQIKYAGFNSSQELKEVIRNANPDVVHIFGTEYLHSYDAAKACEELGILDKTVAYIQGIISFAAKHYFCGVPAYVKYARSFRDIIKRESVNKEKKLFEKKGIYERKTLNMVQHVIGRTDWDYACIRQINPKVKYHFCNETLRDSFYENEWNIENIEKHSVFVSQCNYSLKGFHNVIEAMQTVIKRYPDAKLYTTGRSLLNKNDFMSKLKLTYYEVYLKKLIKKYGLEENVVFLGPLDENKMCERYLKSHVFVSASSVENSPNSVGEAMILGVPTVTSDVGGIKTLFNHNEDGLMYQADAPYMLADCIIKIFESDELAKIFSGNAKKHARVIHNRENNLKTILKIYDEIAGGKTNETI
ncbi:MAG: glycosyltransferase [Clostridia bacterium]|nr:glycosyltransferase [Clostridia bacterium]